MPHFRIKRLNWREWLGLGAAALAVASLFLTWTVLSTDNPVLVEMLAGMPYEATHRGVWRSGVYAWISPLLVIIVSVLEPVLGRFGGLRGSGLPQLWLIGGVVALALGLLGVPAMGIQFDGAQGALLAEVGVTATPGLGRWLGIAAAAVAVLAAALDVLALRAKEPRRRRKPRFAR